MTTMTAARCPKCNIEVGATWRWCLACGYDPDGSAQRVRQSAIEARQREGGWLPVVIVVVGLLVGGAILWQTTPDDTALPESPSTAAEVSSWVPFVPASGGVQVDLPATPPSSEIDPNQAMDSGQPVESYAIGAGGHLFSVSVIDTGRADLASDAPAADVALRGYVEELASAISGEVTEMTTTTLDGVPALDVRIGHAVIGDVRGRVVVVGSRLVSVTVSSRELSSELAGRVIDSLTVS
jgi:hypothetical protein